MSTILLSTILSLSSLALIHNLFWYSLYIVIVLLFAFRNNLVILFRFYITPEKTKTHENLRNGTCIIAYDCAA